jgi:flagellar basal body-associated protein FliL
VNNGIKRRITKRVILLAAIIVAAAASGLAGSFVRAETTAAKTEKNAEYFSGRVDMGAVEATRASSNTLYNAANLITTVFVWVLIVLFVYNGLFAVYEYIKSTERKNEEN